MFFLENILLVCELVWFVRLYKLCACVSKHVPSLVQLLKVWYGPFFDNVHCALCASILRSSIDTLFVSFGDNILLSSVSVRISCCAVLK